MRISLLNDSEQGIGGGWTFMRNIQKGLEKLGHQVSVNDMEAQIALVSGVTMVTRDTIDLVKEKGIKLVVRIDNVPRNSRNRNTGTSRLKEFPQGADEVVWQGRWAKEYLIDFIKREGVIIHNGVDEEIFNPDGLVYRPQPLQGCRPIYLYSRFNRDETKNWEVAWYEYQLIHRENPNAGLIILGKFSPEQQEYNFDFFRGEKYFYTGIIDDPQFVANVYRGSDYLMAPYYNDCFSNTYLEFLMCKKNIVPPYGLYKLNLSGGTPELLELWEKNGREYFTLERMAKDYEVVFKRLLGEV